MTIPGVLPVMPAADQIGEVNHDLWTPATYAFACEYEERMVKQKADIFHDFLDAEPNIYERVFNFFPAMERAALRLDKMFSMFVIFIRGKIEKSSDDDILFFGRPVSHYYFRLAGKPTYWIPGKEKQVDGLLPFTDFLQRWKEGEKDDLARDTLSLEQFISIMHRKKK
jgi:hypothetical protein